MTDKRPIRRIACVGEVMIELIAGKDGAARLGVAGDTYNTAVYLKRLLPAHDVAYVTALGQDPYSDRILEAIKGHWLNTELVERREGAMPGLYAIDTDDEGERSFSYWRSAAAARDAFGADSSLTPADLDGFDLVYLSGISLAILPPPVRRALADWARAFSANGGTFAYDSNYRPRLWESVEEAQRVNALYWGLADIALPSVDDEMELFGDANPDAVLTRLGEMGAANGALKCGAEGPIDLRTHHQYRDGPSAKVVDSTAAGDSFNAGYLAAIARGDGGEAALASGHGLAACVVTYPGAIIPAGAPHG